MVSTTSTLPVWRMQTLTTSPWCWLWDSTPPEKPRSSSNLLSFFSFTCRLCHLYSIQAPEFCVADRYLLEQEIPGSRVGPEPTTDCFTAIMHGEVEGVIPGNALIVDPNKPFRKLNPFGNTFLNRWVCSQGFVRAPFQGVGVKTAQGGQTVCEASGKFVESVLAVWNFNRLCQISE